MTIYLNQVFQINWWKNEYKNNLHQHQLPGIVLGTTAILVNGIWGKQAAIGFSIATVLAYPFAHRAIISLIHFKMHELVYAVAMLVSQFIGLKYPFLSETALFISLLLTASIAIHSSQARDKFQELEKQLRDIQAGQADLKDSLRKSQVQE